LAGYEKALGVDHPYTLTTVDCMAFVFEKQEQYEKALEWYERALVGYEKALGVDHRNTQNTLRSLINLYQSVGQTEQAQNLQARLYAPKSPHN